MKFKAKAKFIAYSPFKLRPVVDVIRGKNAHYALSWLATYKTRRAKAIEKVLKSAVANAQQLSGVGPEDLVIKLFTVDQGPIFKYFKPGAMGRATILRRRFSHLNVELERIEEA
jgi:large subunit ribosomal protein L22